MMRKPMEAQLKTPKENKDVTNAVNAFNDGAITIDQMWDKIFEEIDGVVLED